METVRQVALHMMEQVMLDNGAINRLEPDGKYRYPQKHINAISAAYEEFQRLHPKEFETEASTEVIIGLIIDHPGDEDMGFEGMPQIDKALTDFFEIM